MNFRNSSVSDTFSLCDIAKLFPKEWSTET
jgi:hypothetical protein